MLLHKATNASAPNLGTRDQPIHLEFTSDELNHLGPSQPPERPIASTSMSLPQRPLTAHVPINPQAKTRNAPLGKGKTVFSPFVTSRVRNESLVAAPMTAHNQDISQTLKRKRIDTEPELDLEQAKRSKKSEKKRRKRERRAARMAQLCNKVASQHSPDLHLNFDLERGPSELSSSRGPFLPGVLLATSMRQSDTSAPKSPTETSSRGSHSQEGQDEMMPGQETMGSNEQRRRPPSPYSPLPKSLPLVSIQRPLPSNTNVDKSDKSPRGNWAPVVNQASKPASTGSSALNFKIKERMALLIKQQRLTSEADSLPSASLPQTSNSTTTSKTLFDDTIASKQNRLDQAIAENKAALAQLDTPRNKEQKLALMKAFTERNKLITQLTSDIKTQLDALRSSSATTSMPFSLENPVLTFKWPETEFPLYLIIASDDDEDLNSEG